MGGETKGNENTQQYILRAILESPRDIVIFALDREYRYVAFNDAHRQTMKAIWQVDIAIGSNMLFDVIARPDDRAKAKANFDRALAGEHFVVIEEYGDEKTGNRRYYEDVYSPVVGEDGSILGLTVFLTDITEKRRAQEELAVYQQKLETLVDERTAALQRSEALYRTLVVNSPVAVMVYRDSRLLFVNPAAILLSGERDEASLLARSTDDLVELPAWAQGAPGVVRTELSIVRRDGTRADVEWTSIPVDFEGGPATLSLAVDITGRKRAEAERRRLEDQMRHTQKLESLGLLAGGIAHDFNNLLVGILGNADLALRSDDPRQMRTLLQRIRTASVRAAELTGQMLAYSGKGPFIVKPLDLSGIASEMADLMNVTVSKNTHLVFDLASSLPAVEGDAAQIRQVVMNLITNAADAIGDTAGTIRLKTSVIDADRAFLSSMWVDDALSPGRYVCLEVTDTGIGMDETTRAKLFDPFFTTKAKGRGLGLSAVVGIVRSHGGAIRVASEPGKGSSFRVFLPATDREVTPEVAQPPAATEWRASGTVLIADDEPRVRQVLSMMLTDIGFKVLEAESAHACLETYRKHADAINAVMVDLMMPGGGGGEVVRTLRAEGHAVPVVVSSGYSEDAVGQELRSDPKLAFLEKPFDFQTFVRTLKTVIEAA